MVVAIAQGIGTRASLRGRRRGPGRPDGNVSTAEFDAALKQAAARQGAKQVPAPSAPAYSALHDAAMSDVLLSRWVRGEAEERGVTVSDSEISNQLQQVIKQQFGGQKKFQQFLKQAHFTAQEARDRVELQMISTEIQKQVLAKTKGQAAQRATAEHFQTEFIAKWRSRTSCSAPRPPERAADHRSRPLRPEGMGSAATLRCPTPSRSSW